MKRCPYCGQEYSDEYSVCATDQNPLESCNPKPHPEPSNPVESEASGPPPSSVDFDWKVPADFTWKAVAAAGGKVVSVPEGFGLLGTFASFNAKRLLNKFAEAGIRFHLRKIEKRRVIVAADYADYDTDKEIQIFVHRDDEEAAVKIYTSEWKV